MTVNNFLTFDIEEWFHANYEKLDSYVFDTQSTNLESNVDRLIDLCDTYGVKTTCFILGSVAKNKPYIVKKLFDAGHEIASHGSSHKLIYPMTPEEFRCDLKASTDVLEQITGKKTVGFRAPSWSVKRETLPWFYEVLAEEKFRYSSSVYPAKNTIFGIPNFLDTPHYPTSASILEIPQSVMNFFGNRVGYAGGGYLRFFPTWLIKREIGLKNSEGKPVFIYLHPREIDIHQPRLKLGMMDGYFHYQGIAGCEEKLSLLLAKFQHSFIRMDEYALKSQAILGALPKRTQR
ncbi:MAG: polysaccharide deacetylase family protein [Sulfuricurvum sp.]|nr:polysaccharide deacetylase family protein [Sulfuricurvum sp.]MDD5387014.1 polysaccharide deacetylase family protein [Sulfuricurvum sp.]